MCWAQSLLDPLSIDSFEEGLNDRVIIEFFLIFADACIMFWLRKGGV
jgi:hypothetical protein